MEKSTSFEFMRALNKWVKNHLRHYVTIDGIVTNINKNNTVDITVQCVTYTSVPTKVLTGSQASIYEIPVLNSVCLVCWRDGNKGLPQIVSFDQVDSYYINVNNFYIKAGLTQFNGGNNGGIPISSSVATRLNNIENWINNFIPDFESHTHILALTEGTGTAAPTVTQPPAPLIETQPSDIENTAITQ